MGLFSWLFGGTRQKKQRLAELPGTGEFRIEVVGESHYQKAINKITGGKTEEGHELEIDAILIHQDDNPHDNKAVAVTIEDEIVGYLDRALARQFRNQMEAAGFEGSPAACRAMIVGGWNRGGKNTGHYGVRLDLPFQED